MLVNGKNIANACHLRVKRKFLVGMGHCIAKKEADIYRPCFIRMF